MIKKDKTDQVLPARTVEHDKPKTEPEKAVTALAQSDATRKLKGGGTK